MSNSTRPHLSDFVDVPPFVYLSGQMAFRTDGILVGGIAAQTRQCLDNIANVLATLGLDLNDVVKSTVWLRRADDFESFNTEYAAVFGTHRPARSTVVSDLLFPEALIEIEAVAHRYPGGRQ